MMHTSTTFHSLTTNTSLQNIFLAKKDSLIKKILFLLGGVLALTLASQLSIPFQPVPLTFQSTIVILIGMAYGPRYGATVIITYLIAGACGLPVFANFSAGIPKFFGPTGGYLIGFLPATILSGYLAEKGFAKTILKSFIAACLGDSVIFILGVTLLATIIGWHDAIALGFLPFIISEPIKLLFISCFIPRLWKKN